MTVIRPSSYETDCYPWVLANLPTDHPARFCATFVVHGMGEPKFAQTAATLRAGFEDNMGDVITTGKKLPPPYISEGYWGNYDNLEQTFPAVWKDFGRGEKTFFSSLWQMRSHSAISTVFWFLGQLWSLVGPRAVKEIGWKTQLIYWPLQILFPIALVILILKMRTAVTNVLTDVRVYCAPKGMIEEVIVQGIDHRVARSFLRLIGLDENFRALDDEHALHANRQTVRFSRVIWVAHSLGTVVSYNALSDLFGEAARLAKAGDDKQKAGVEKFRSSLAAFVTMGSPLDKIAYLCGRAAIKPWPAPRAALLAGDNKGKEDWWINYFNVLDPVSGSLDNPLLFKTDPVSGATFEQTGPQNFHVEWKMAGLIPGLAHVAYWKDTNVLRVVLKLAYGKNYPEPLDTLGQKIPFRKAIVGYLVWLAVIVLLLLTLALAVIWAMHKWTPFLLPDWLNDLFGHATTTT